MAELEGLMRKVSRIVEYKFNRKGEQTPYFYCIRENGKRFIFDPEKVMKEAGGGAAVKDTLAAVVQVMMAAMKIDRYVMAMEVWKLGGDNLTEEQIAAYRAYYASGRGISQHPDRYECIYYAAEDVDGTNLQGEQPIIRPAGGKVYLGELEIDKLSDQEGRFANLLTMRRLALKAKRGG